MIYKHEIPILEFDDNPQAVDVFLPASHINKVCHQTNRVATGRRAIRNAVL